MIFSRAFFILDSFELTNVKICCVMYVGTDVDDLIFRFLLEQAPLFCPLGCRGNDPATPILVYADPENLEHVELNADYWRNFCRKSDKMKKK